MKIFKKITAVLLTVIMLFTCLACSKSVNATIVYEKTGKELEQNLWPEEYKKLQKKDLNEYQFNSTEILSLYALNLTEQMKDNLLTKKTSAHQIKIPLYNLSNNALIKDGAYSDGKLDARDASAILTLIHGDIDDSYVLGDYKNLKTHISADGWVHAQNEIKASLAEQLNVSKDDISTAVTVTYPKIDGYTDNETSYVLTDKSSFEDEEILKKIDSNMVTDYKISTNASADNIKYSDFEKATSQEYITVTAKVKNKSYIMYIGEDKNFYFENVGEEIPDFKTDLTYRAVSEGKSVEGKMSSDGSTYLPPYYEDEDKDAKKDADAIAIIKSKTDEEIVATNGVEMKNDGSANSEGWYYPDTNNKKVIEKVYPFDTYNNPKDNGAVKETVKLTGKDGGEDTQTPTIEWILRRINFEKTVNSDKSTTITITYNLPIEKSSIPEGWEPITDSDGGIRKITRTFKPTENYDKDVTVEQNGPSTATVTTPVKVTAEKLPDNIPQAGAFYAVLAISIAGIVIFMITRYRKLNK